MSVKLCTDGFVFTLCLHDSKDRFLTRPYLERNKRVIHPERLITVTAFWVKGSGFNWWPVPCLSEKAVYWILPRINRKSLRSQLRPAFMAGSQGRQPDEASIRNRFSCDVLYRAFSQILL